MVEHVRNILNRLYSEEYVQTCFDEAWDANVADMINQELTDDEIVEFIEDIGGSEIFCKEKYVLAYLNSITVLPLHEFIDNIRDHQRSVVYTRLSTDKVIIINY